MAKAKGPPPLIDRQRPGLSETLPYPRAVAICQSCGLGEQLADHRFQRWRECDQFDKPTTPAVVLILCRPCSKRLIDPHPRLYIEIDLLEPVPGIMELCAGCRHARALSCGSPLLKSNGGPGLGVTYPRPDEAILCPGGHHITFWKGPPSKCAGLEVLWIEQTPPEPPASPA